MSAVLAKSSTLDTLNPVPAEFRATGLFGTWPARFLVFEFTCQIALLFEAVAPFRVPIRVAAFAASLAIPFFRKSKGDGHPSSQMALLIVLFLVLSLPHPSLNSFTAGLAQIALYTAILAPLVWAEKIDFKGLRNVLIIFWAFHTVSSAVGILQVWYPGSFLPALSTSVSQDWLEGLSITTSTGERVLRPMGLTDQPGGAGTAGFYAFLIGMGFLMSKSRLGLRVIAAASIPLGLACILLSHDRSLLVLTAISTIGALSIAALQGQGKKVLAVATVILLLGLIGVSLTLFLAGDSVTERLSTLTADAPSTVYYENRGSFLENTIYTIIPTYPFGAGLGRWGMTNSYFGDNSRVETQPIWVEIQLTGWILDGGIPLALVYSAAILIALWTSLRIAWSKRIGDSERTWAIILVVYNVATLALTFDYPVFISQFGLEFWLLNACLFSAAKPDLIDVPIL